MHRMSLRTSFALLSLAVALAASAQSIDLKAIQFDPGVAIPALPADLVMSQAETQSTHYAVVQFKGVLTASQWAELKALDLAPIAYVPDHAYVFLTTPSQRESLKALDGVRFVGPYQPYYKLSPQIGRVQYRTLERLAESKLGLRRLVVSLFPGRAGEATLARAHELGIGVLSVDPNGGETAILIRATPQQARLLATVAEIAFIDEAGEATFRNDIETWVVQSNVDNQRPVWNRGIRGQGQIGGVIDGALDRNHHSFADPQGDPVGQNHRKILAYNGSAGADSHGTHVSGTMAGNMEPMNGSTSQNGMAPEARIVFTNLSSISSNNLYTRLSTAVNQGARVHTNSWGNDGTGSYDNWARDIDRISWDFEDNAVAFAVSNGSILRNPENAKSVLAVGATQLPPNQGRIGSGGRGPTTDGRRKPEVFTPGISTISSRAGTTTGMTSLSGTSMACPSASGAMLLARQYYMEGFLANGRADASRGFIPSGALLRATVMNASVDMTGTSGYPTNNEGWGRILLDNALWFEGETRRTLAWDVRNGSGLTTGGQVVYTFANRTANQPLRVTMTFTDFPGAAFAQRPVVNDLNLEVVAPDGTIYLGNDFDTTAGQSRTGGAADALNSTEMVIRNQPLVGTWTIRVRGAAVNQGPRQGFAVVVSGDIQRTLPNIGRR